MLGSSTPDGLAPLSREGVFIFAVTLSTVPILYGITNLVILIKQFNNGA
jgi:hypothetical protein